jgi:hypothetical protein
MVYATCKNVGGFMIGVAIPWSLCILMRAAAFIVLYTVNVLQESPTHVDSMHGAKRRLELESLLHEFTTW